MVLRLVVYSLMALGLLGFGTVAWISVQPPPEQKEAAAPVVQTDAILVAGRDIFAGVLLKSDDIAIQQVPHDKLPDNAVLDTPANRHALAGAMVRRRVPTGSLLRSGDLLRPGDHGFLAAVLTPGMRAVTVGVDAITGTAGLIWPGDHVDVLLTHQLDDPNRPVGRRVAAETLLTDVRVIAIDQQLVQGAAPGTNEGKPATTVTLEVTPAQSERVSVAGRIGRLSLVVRAAGSAENYGQSARDGNAPAVGDPIRTQGAITWAGDVSPALVLDAPIKPPPAIMRVFRGSADGLEYKFQ